MTKFTPHKELTTRYGGEIVIRNREPIELRSNETHTKKRRRTRQSSGQNKRFEGSREHNPLNRFYESNGPGAIDEGTDG